MAEGKKSKRRRQGGSVCSAFNCTNAFYSNSNKGFHFFSFPRDKERCDVWIQNARREDLLKVPIDKLSTNFKLCSVHFKASQFTVPSERKRLNWNAVPTIFNVSNPPSTPKRVYKPRPLLRKGINVNCDNEVPPCDTTVENEVEKSADISISHKEVPHPGPTGKTKKLIEQNLAQMEYSETESAEDEKPFPTTLLVNETLRPTKVLGSSVTEAKTSTVGSQTEERENAVEFLNDTRERESQLIAYSSRMKCKSAGTQAGTDSDVSSDDEKNDKKVGRNVVYCFLPNEIKVENDDSDDFESNIGRTTNTEGYRSTELYSNKQEMLKDCTVYNRPRIEKGKEDLWENNETEMSTTLTQTDDQRIGLKTQNRLNLRMRIDPGDETEKFSECNYVEINRYSDSDSDESSSPNGQSHIHMDDLKDGKPFKCTVCGKTFTCTSKLARHMRHHTGETPFKCTVCGEAFTQESHLTTHMRRHTGETPFECIVCDKAFTQKSHLKRHLILHRGERPFDCIVCGKAFTQNCHLKAHMRLHTEEKNYYECTVCYKAFTRTSGLSKHMKIHTGKKPYKCTLCDRAFIQNCNLKTHMRLHAEKKNDYECTVCNKLFTRNSDLKMHMRHHTGEKRYYECTVCDKALTRSSDLTKHMRIHTGEKPHKCLVCFKSFIQKSHLTIHMTIHTGEKPHKCSVCLKTFNQKSHLAKHTRLHCGNNLKDVPSGCD